MGKRRPGKLSRRIVYKRTKRKCFYCGKRATTLDHVIPRSHGGSNDIDNLVAACEPCNQVAGQMVFPSREHKRSYILSIIDKPPMFVLESPGKESTQ